MKDTHVKSRCKARTKAGEPCSAAPREGGLCYLHANPNKATELGRAGSEKPPCVCRRC